MCSYWEGDIRLIDFPQAVAPAENPDAFELLGRDIQRLCQYFERYGLRTDDQGPHARPVDPLWRRRVKNRWTCSTSWPTPGKAVMKPADYARLLRRYLRPQWRRVAVLAALLVGGLAVQLVNPQIIRYFLDTVQSGGSQQLLAGAAVAFVGVALLQRVHQPGRHLHRRASGLAGHQQPAARPGAAPLAARPAVSQDTYSR